MTNKMKRYAAFLLSLTMLMSAVPALATEGQAITGAIGFGGIILEEETQGSVNPAGPVLGQNVALELTIGVPKTFSVYGFDYTNVTGFFDARPDMQISGLVKTEVPDVFVNGAQVYLYDFTLTAGALYLDYIYPSNVVSYDGTNASQMSANWTLKVIADTAPADLVPKGQLLDETTETINAAIGARKTVSFYGFDYTSPANFFNDSSVEVSYERFAVPGAYANGAHAVYLYNMTITLNQAYNTGDGGRLYTNNIVFYNDGVGTPVYYTDWRINVTEEEAESEVGSEQETEAVEKPDLSNVQLSVSSNLEGKERVKLGTELVMNATIDGGEGMTFHIWWQCSTDGGQSWTDVPGAVGSQYRVVITRENAGMEWRACADLIEWETAE